MATSSQASVLSAACSRAISLNNPHGQLALGRNRVFCTRNPFRIRASSAEDDCNEVECAPEKEVGKVSMEWLAEDRTKVVGTYPPKKRGWTGYVEKDTAGQTNVYSVEPAVYVAESAISSGTAGTSSDGSENTLAIAGGLALIAIASASSILLQVDKKTPPPVQTAIYSGPSLTYYIDKFKPPEVIPASAPTPTTDQVEAAEVAKQEDVAEVQVESGLEAAAIVDAPALN